MKKNLALVVCLIFLGVTFLSGCDEPPPPEPPKPKIVRKKIGNIPPEVLKKKAEAEEKTPPLPLEKPVSDEIKESSDVLLAKTSESKNNISALENQKSEIKQSAEVPAAPSNEQPDTDSVKDELTQEAEKNKAVGNAADAAAEQKAVLNEEPQADENDLKDKNIEIDKKNAEKKESSDTVPLVFPDAKDKALLAYNSAGKIDPFAPLFKNEPKKKKKSKAKKSKKPTRRLTPLERLDLGQLKLVGIVWAENGNKALVEESSGKGYIITKGTYIGIHSGRVVDILKDKIVVEEQDEDDEGNPVTHKRELKFQRPDGELL